MGYKELITFGGFDLIFKVTALELNQTNEYPKLMFCEEIKEI